MNPHEIPLHEDPVRRESCSICLDDTEIPPPVWRTLPCRHEFHQHCIESWQRVRNTCPLCLHPIESRPSSITIVLRPEEPVGEGNGRRRVIEYLSIFFCYVMLPLLVVWSVVELFWKR